MGYFKDQLKFFEKQRAKPEKVDIAVRKREFSEIYKKVITEEIEEQANRCVDCGSPYCEWKCPVHNYIPDWLALANQGKIIEAAELCHTTNSLPEVCGRICPQDLLCEGACTLNDANGAVTIGEVEKYITDTAFAMGWQPDISKVEKTQYKVAVIGAGPAGLACADVLIRNGIQVTVFDKYPEIGGLLTFGIPPFKLEKQVLQKRKQIFENMGIEFKLNTTVGKDIAIESIERNYDLIFLAMGTYSPLTGKLDHQIRGVHLALEYLIGNVSNLLSYNMSDFPFIDAKDQRVLVLGGGDTAMDCNRTSVRLGAKSVHCAYRRDEINMPGSKGELQSAKEEGVKFLYNYQPIEILKNDANQVQGVRFVKTRQDNSIISKSQSNLWDNVIKKNLGYKNKRIDFKNTDEKIVVPADKVIIAFGFQPNPANWLQNMKVEFNDNQTIKINRQSNHIGITSNPKIFSGGDMIRGADLVVTAINDGRESAQSMVKLLLNK